MQRDKYPPDWDALSREVREAAGQRCQQCGVANGAVGARDRHGDWHDEQDIHHLNSDVGYDLFGDEFPKIIRIVLTVHHIDRDPGNNARSNLVALCQKDHLAADRPHHLANAAATRARKRAEVIAATGQIDLI